MYVPGPGVLYGQNLWAGVWARHKGWDSGIRGCDDAVMLPYISYLAGLGPGLLGLRHGWQVLRPGWLGPRLG